MYNPEKKQPVSSPSESDELEIDLGTADKKREGNEITLTAGNTSESLSASPIDPAIVASEAANDRQESGENAEKLISAIKSGASGGKLKEFVAALAVGTALAVDATAAQAEPVPSTLEKIQTPDTQEQRGWKEKPFSGSVEHPTLGKISIELQAVRRSDGSFAAEQCTAKINGKDRKVLGALQSRAKNAPAMSYIIEGEKPGAMDYIRLHIDGSRYTTKDEGGNELVLPITE
ncbi:MAG: hypothetical protein IPJ68_00345 [Candidatus Moraniibacteriota bacterium]|nr:MAG: hypothetical protein IPJ68_00345 [Candidatus Moranbacteria bacterium]